MPKLNIDLSTVVSYLKQNAGQKSIRDMEEELNLSITFIRKVASSQGICLQYKKPVEEKVSKIKDLLDQGLTPHSISQKINCRYSHVTYLMQRYIGYTPKTKVSTSESEMGYFNPSLRENWLV
jgi:hypothetical protein